MLLQANRDFGIRLDASVMIGDKNTDIVAGQRAGVAITVLLKENQYEIETLMSSKPTFVVRNLEEAAEVILGEHKR